MRAAVVGSVITLLICGSILAGRYTGVELLVPESDIIFAHADHVDLECADCHTGIEESSAAQDQNLPSMDVCGDCHDVEAEEDCGTCHRNPEDPQASPRPERGVVFSHKDHLKRELECATCHGAVASSTESSPEHMPLMHQCFSCLNGEKAGDGCALCHDDHITLADIHPTEWRHQHGDRAALDREWCRQCHQEDNTCLDCHRGDNLTGYIHDLNYMYTHGLDAKSKRFDCARCHDNRSFCYACHERENLIPLLHSSVSWLTDHGSAARRDAENCASCHDSAEPTCARPGCHRDADGLRGTDPRYHAPHMTLFDSYGPWHGDDGYYCYDCHVSSRRAGQGFCGYCHGYEKD